MTGMAPIPENNQVFQNLSNVNTNNSNAEAIPDVQNSVFDAFAQNGVEKGNYDFLDDETGLLNASFQELDEAVSAERANASLNSDYSAKIIKTQDGDNTTFQYDSDGDGRYETMAFFNTENETLSGQALKISPAESASVTYNENGESYRISDEDSTASYNSETGRVYYETEEGVEAYDAIKDADGNITEMQHVDKNDWKFGPDA